MLFRILPLFAFICLSDAKEPVRTPSEWENELSAAFAKNSGYIARYEGHMQDLRMEATIGTDQAGTLVFQLTMTNGAQKQTTRMWTNGDEYNIDLGEPSRRFLGNGLNHTLARMHQLTNELALMPNEKKPGPMTLEPMLMMSKTVLQFYCYATFPSLSPWKGLMPKAIGAAAGDEEVLFNLGTDGEIAISRKSGMMTRQKIEDDRGRREIVLVSVELNPSAEALSELKNGWSNEGAQKLDFFSTYRGYHAVVLASKVIQVDRAEVPVEQLEEVLQAKADLLRAYFRQFVYKLDPEEKTTWEEYIDYAKSEMKQKLKTKAGEAIDEAELKAQLNTPEVRTEIRNTLTRQRESDRRDILPLLLGEDYEQSFAASTDAGKKAAKTIEDAVIHAYTAAEIETRMEEVWEPDEPGPIR